MKDFEKNNSTYILREFLYYPYWKTNKQKQDYKMASMLAEMN